MNVKPNGYFSVAGSGSEWTWPDVVYDNIYTNYARTTGRQYYYTVSLTEAQAEKFEVKVRWNLNSRPECTYSLAFGDKIAFQIIKRATYTPAAADSYVPFNLTAAERAVCVAHAGELLLGVKTAKSSQQYLGEIDFVVPDSQIYVGEKNATAVYVGNKQATAVYVGDERVL